MSDRKMSAATIATALAGAVSLAMLAAPVQASSDAKEKCYGISKVGENDCKNAAGTHDCKGMSKVAYDGGEYKYVAKGTCMQMQGKLEPFQGTNPNIKS